MALIRSRRLDAILGSPIDRLTEVQIHALVDNKAAESFDLDFKGTLYGNSDKDRRSLCGDVAALANASGGVLILGVEEDDRAIASATPGVALGDAERNRMLQIVASGIAPLPAFEILPIESRDNPTHGWWLLIVPRSTRAPHAVIVNDGLRFPIRNGTTIRYQSEPEVAAAYRLRDLHAGDLVTRITELMTESLANVDRNHGPWVVTVLAPEHPGSLEINQRRLRRMQDQYIGTDLFDVGRTGASFQWVRAGRGKYTAGDGPYPNSNSSLPHYGYAEFHTDGNGAYAVELADIATGRPRLSETSPDPNNDQMVLDEVVALSILTGLRRLASHARDSTGAAGSATAQVCLVPSPGRTLVIGHTRQYGFPDSRSGNSMSKAALAETAAALDELGDPGPELAATAARLLDELGTSFGIAEMGQLSLDGEVRRRYWRDSSSIVAWAEQYGVSVTDAVISDS